MDVAQIPPKQQLQIKDAAQIAEPVSSTVRFLLILLCLLGGLSIAYLQVVASRKESIELHDTLTTSQRALRLFRLILLNAISGILLMMATSIGTREASLVTFEADFHNLVDPQLTQIKIDCFRIHAIRWLQYSSGWQIFTNLAKHAHSLHLWALPVEFVCALLFFIGLVVLDGRDKKSKIALPFSALAHASFPSYWVLWAAFGSLLLAALRDSRCERAPLLPLFEPKSRKPSRPVERSRRNEEVRQLCIAALGLYLLSANFYGFCKSI
jgi:hypothetical protein